MKNTKYYVLGLIVALVIGGSYFYPKQKEASVVQVGAVGDFNSTSRIAQLVVDMTTTTPTTINGACLTNGDSRDRIVTSVDFYLASLGSFTSNGTGLVNLIFTLATSSGVYIAPSGSQLLNTSVTTTTPQLFVSSSTPGVSSLSTGSFSRVWAAGSCLNLFQNGTTTATGVLRIGYLVSQ